MIAPHRHGAVWNEKGKPEATTKHNFHDKCRTANHWNIVPNCGLCCIVTEHCEEG